MTDHLIQYLVRESNRHGRNGMKIIGWIAPTNAGQDYRGAFVYEGNPPAIKAATEGK